jgi:glycosyltransferase involved in cell wall biosynthesis
MTEGSVSEVGFVVIGRNEGARLENCLRSVLSVSDRVVYADSASSDGSVEAAKRLGVPVVQLPPDGKLTAARGRNAGYKELQSRFPGCDAVQFIDGDCILQPEWLPRAISFLNENPKVAVVCGRRFEAHPEASIYNRLCDREWDTPVGEAKECGGDALVRCAAFDTVGGYRSELQAGEEPEMTARMRAAGWQIWRIDARMTEHDARIHSLRQWWKRTQRGGFGYAQVWTATKDLPRRLYDRQLRSALFWAFGLPAAVILVVAVTKQPWLLLALPIAYGVQLMRIAGRSDGQARSARAALTLLAKFPEAIGAARFLLASHRHMPEYKS